MTDQECITTIRCLAMDMVQKANSGHPGAPMGMAPMAHVLWTKFMNYNPANPKWHNRDRFVLSNGHACALLYSMLHLTGYEDFSMDELKRFRQVGSKTPGHPEAQYVDGNGIEVTTGPLGQGFANAVGLAIAEANLAATFNKPEFNLVSNYTYVFTGDGCLMEGVSAEAASLAGHLGLGRLIVLYDDNNISIDGNTGLAFTENVGKRFEAYGWHVQHVTDGNTDVNAISKAIEEAQKVTDRPSIINVKTTIGFGSAVANSYKAHGSPLGAEDVANVKKKFGVDPEKFFYIPDSVKAVYEQAKVKGKQHEEEWNALFAKYSEKYPELAKDFSRRVANKLPENWKSVLPTYAPDDKPAKATRQYSQTVINALAKVVPEIIGGSADLNPSTLSYLDCSKDFQKNTPEGRNIRFGVREHAMVAICNGIHAYGGYIAYCATFLNFIGYAMGAVTLSALTRNGIIYVMTHDSIGLGEDGPTHQPINSLMMIRTLPNIFLIRPADGNETSGAYAVALEHRHTPSVLCLSRQGVPSLKGTSIEGVYKGAYTISDAEDGKPQLILVGSGSEVSLCVGAAAALKDLKVRVVSMPCWELFRAQSKEYQKSIFPDGVPVLACEAASVIGWREFAHAVVGMSTFGESGPYKEVYTKFGITVDNLVNKAKQVVDFYGGKAPSVIDRPF